VTGHEGRNRMLAIKKIEGDNPVEVHIFINGDVKKRHLTREMIEELEVALINEIGKLVVGNLFETQ
jgi:tRNA-dihydrouridine synthase